MPNGKKYNTQVSQLAWPPIAIGSVLLVVALLAAFWLYRIQQSNAQLLSQDVKSVEDAYQLELTLRELRGILTRFMLSNDPEYKSRLPLVQSRVNEILTQVADPQGSSGEKQAIATIREGVSEFTKIVNDVMEHPNKSFLFEDQRKIDLLFDEKLVTPAEDYRSINEELINRTSTRTNEAVVRMIWGFIFIGLCGSIGGAFYGVSVSRKVRNSIVQLSIPIHDAAGKLERVIGDVQIHDVKNLSDLNLLSHKISSHVSEVVDRLQKKEREILRNEQLAAVGQLAAGIAHEIRNPLMAVKILVQNSLETMPAQLGAEDLAVIDEEINRVESSVRALLNFARPIPLVKQTVNVQEMVHDAVRLIAGKIHVMDIKIDINVPTKQIELLADKQQIHQVLINLLFNAIDEAGSHGSISIEVKAPTLEGARVVFGDSKAKMLAIVISDSGLGISQDKRVRVFEPFFSTKTTGTGLGLSVCKRIVEQHGGEITIHDSMLGGAAFCVYLPLRQLDSETVVSQLHGLPTSRRLGDINV